MIKTVGEIELKVIDLPKEIRSKIVNYFIKNGGKKGGRPNLLKMIKEQGKNPYKIILEIIYLKNIEDKSYDDIVRHLERKYGIITVKSSVFNVVQKLKNIKEDGRTLYDVIYEYSVQKVKRKIKIYYIDEKGDIKSDIGYINQFIEQRKYSRSKEYTKRILSIISWVTNKLRKLPHEWTIEELIRLRNEIYEKRLHEVKKLVEKANLNNNWRSTYYKLNEYEIESLARNYVYKQYLTPIRQILSFLGKNEYLPRLETKSWKVVNSDIEKRKEYLDISELKKILKSDAFDLKEKIVIMLEITTGARHYFLHKDAGILGLRVEDFYYTGNVLRVDIRERKTGLVWRGIRIDLLDDLYEKISGLRLQKLLEEYVLKYGKKEKVLKILLGERYDKKLKEIHERIETILQRRFTSHFMRHTHATLLIRLGISMELIAGKPDSAEFGSGWLDLNTLYKFYVALGSFKYQQEYNVLKENIQKITV